MVTVRVTHTGLRVVTVRVTHTGTEGGINRRTWLTKAVGGPKFANYYSMNEYEKIRTRYMSIIRK